MRVRVQAWRGGGGKGPRGACACDGGEGEGVSGLGRGTGRQGALPCQGLGASMQIEGMLLVVVMVVVAAGDGGGWWAAVGEERSMMSVTLHPRTPQLTQPATTTTKHARTQSTHGHGFVQTQSNTPKQEIQEQPQTHFRFVWCGWLF